MNILAINETRLDQDVLREVVFIPSHTLISKDITRFSGGIGLYIRNTINLRVRSDLSNDEIEVLTVEIDKYKVKPFLINTWYRPVVPNLGSADPLGVRKQFLVVRRD